MRSAVALLAACLALGCRDNGASPIRLVLGPTPADELSLVPRAAIAEYIELSPTESSLLITLSSTERSCESSPSTDVDAVVLALRVVLPGGAKLEPGSFPIAPAPAVQPVPATLDAAAAAPAPVEKPHLLSSVKWRGRRQELRPGGDLELRQLDLSQQGLVDGLLRLEFPGDAEHPATRVSGRFLAHFCRINRLR